MIDVPIAQRHGLFVSMQYRAMVTTLGDERPERDRFGSVQDPSVVPGMRLLILDSSIDLSLVNYLQYGAVFTKVDCV